MIASSEKLCLEMAGLKSSFFAKGARLAVAMMATFASISSAAEFNPNTDGQVFALAVQSDGKILVAGAFTEIASSPRRSLARLNPNGTLDSSFRADVDFYVYTVAIQPDGRILVAGNFATIAGASRNFIARLNPDGSLDTAFNPNANSLIRSLVLQPDGKILLGGNFANIGGTTRWGIARLNSNGTVDATFDPNFNSQPSTDIYALALEPNGNVVVGGIFASIGGQPRSCIARLGTNGTVDGSFNPVADHAVKALVLQPNGKVLVGGKFTSIGGATRGAFARLNADGTADPSFDPNFGNVSSSEIHAVTLQTTGHILIGGNFTRVGGLIRNGLARIDRDDR